MSLTVVNKLHADGGFHSHVAYTPPANAQGQDRPAENGDLTAAAAPFDDTQDTILLQHNGQTVELAWPDLYEDLLDKVCDNFVFNGGNGPLFLGFSYQDNEQGEVIIGDDRSLARLPSRTVLRLKAVRVTAFRRTGSGSRATIVLWYRYRHNKITLTNFGSIEECKRKGVRAFALNQRTDEIRLVWHKRSGGGTQIDDDDFFRAGTEGAIEVELQVVKRDPQARVSGDVKAEVVKHSVKRERDEASAKVSDDDDDVIHMGKKARRSRFDRPGTCW